MFDNKELIEFNPDIIFIHATNRNIIEYLNLLDDEDKVTMKLEKENEQFIINKYL